MADLARSKQASDMATVGLAGLATACVADLSHAKQASDMATASLPSVAWLHDLATA